jgi:hypothetical protein
MSTIGNNSNPNFYQLNELSGTTCNDFAELVENVPHPNKRAISLLIILVRQTIIQRKEKDYTWWQYINIKAC